MCSLSLPYRCTTLPAQLENSSGTGGYVPYRYSRIYYIFLTVGRSVLVDDTRLAKTEMSVLCMDRRTQLIRLNNSPFICKGANSAVIWPDIFKRFIHRLHVQSVSQAT